MNTNYDQLQPIHAAYQQGRHDALSELMPVADVAATLGVDTSHVHRLARTHGPHQESPRTTPTPAMYC